MHVQLLWQKSLGARSLEKQASFCISGIEFQVLLLELIIKSESNYMRN
jgi:hypothetical protein